MAQFNIKAGILLQILKFTQASGRNIKGENKPLLSDCLLILKSGKNQSLNINSIEENQALIVKVSTDQVEVKKGGSIPIEIEPAIKSLKRYKASDEISVEFKNGMIIFSRSKPKLTVKIPTIDVDSVESNMDQAFPFKFTDNIWVGKKSGLKLDNIIEINATEFKEVVEDGEQIQYRSFPFVVSPKKVVVIVEDVDSGASITRELKTNEILCKKQINSLYSYGFGNAFGNLTGDIKIWIANEAPMIISKETNDFNLTYMLATTELEIEEEGEEESENSDNVDEKIAEQLEDSLDSEEIVEEDLYEGDVKDE